MTHLQKILAHATFRRGLLALFAAPLFAGCASFVGQDTERLQIASTPPDAQILIIDEAGRTAYRGRTPDKVVLPKSDGRYWGGKTFTVAISKAGYLTRRVTVDTHPNALYLGGNWLFGGLIGWLIVDPTSGRMYDLSSDGIQVTLQKKPEAPPLENGAAPEEGLSAVPLPAEVASSAADLRPRAPPLAATPVGAIPPSQPAPVIESPRAEPPPRNVPPLPPAPGAAAPSIFVPERPPGSARAWVPVTPTPGADVASPAPAPPSREPLPYWPAPPALPVSPSTALPASLLLAQR